MGCLSVKRMRTIAFALLKPYFHGNDQADRRAVLIGKILAVHAEAKQGQRMHGFVHAQAFDVGPLEDVPALARHLRRVQDAW